MPVFSRCRFWCCFRSLMLVLSLAGATKVAEAQRRGVSVDLEGPMCRSIRAWLMSPSLPQPIGRQEAAAQLLISDERFQPAFGKRASELSSEEKISIRDVLRPCLGREVRQFAFHSMAAYAALDPDRPIRPKTQVRAVGTASEQLEALVRELSSLQETEVDYDRMIAIRAEGHRLSLQLPGNRGVEFNYAYKPVEVRIAPRIEFGRVSQLLQTARGVPGVVAMDRMQRWLNQGSYDPELARTREGQRLQLQDRMVEVLRSIASAELAQISTLGSGLGGLERGQVWYRDYAARNAPIRHFAQVVTVDSQYRRWRENAMTTASPALLALVKERHSASALDSLVARTMDSLDVKTRPGKAVMVAVALRKHEIHRRVVLGQYAANAATMRDARAPSLRAPNAEEMFDAISAHVLKISGFLSATGDDCQSGPSRKSKNSLVATVCIVTLMNPSSQVPPVVDLLRHDGCRRIQNQPGYLCDFAYGVRAPRGGAIDPWSYIWSVARGQRQTARWVYDDGWMWFALEDE